MNTNNTPELFDFDGDAAAMWIASDAHIDYSSLTAGLYLTDPQGHAFLAGTNQRGLVVLASGPRLVDIGSVHVTSPEVLEQLADRLRMLAGRMRERSGVTA